MSVFMIKEENLRFTIYKSKNPNLTKLENNDMSVKYLVI